MRQIPEASLMSWDASEQDNDDTLFIEATVRLQGTLTHQQARTLQEQIAARLQRPVALSLSMIPSTELRAYVPPTPTPTGAPTSTSTPTRTPTPLPTATATAAPTATPTPTMTPAPTITPPPTPHLLRVEQFGARVRYSPNGLEVGRLPRDTVVQVLNGPVTVAGTAWVQVTLLDGTLHGWVLVDALSAP